MSTYSVEIRAAMETAVKAITPTVRATQKFRLLDGDDEPLETSVPSDMFRRCAVTYGKYVEGPYQAIFDAETEQAFFVTVVYPLEGNYSRTLDDVIERDRDDLRNAINNFQNWRGSLADPTALLHAFIPDGEPRLEKVAGRLLSVVEVSVQFLRTVT